MAEETQTKLAANAAGRAPLRKIDLAERDTSLEPGRRTLSIGRFPFDSPVAPSGTSVASSRASLQVNSGPRRADTPAPRLGSESGDAIERSRALGGRCSTSRRPRRRHTHIRKGRLVNGPHNPSRAFTTRLNLRRVAMRSVRFCWLARLAKVPPSCWRRVPRRLRQALSRTNLLGQRRESHRGNQNRSREIPAAVPYQAQQQYLHTIH